MYGLVHPYTLTWEVHPEEDETDTTGSAQDYCIPVLIVRDQGYQPYVQTPLLPKNTHPFPRSR